MSDKNFGERYQDDVINLITHYEEMEKNDSNYFFEESSFEQIIDYYEERQKNAKAAKVADMAIAQYPYSSYFQLKKAQFLFDSKQFDQALELLDKAEVFDPQDLNIHLLRADIYVWLEDFNKAITSINSGIEICEEEDLADLYLELADIYEEWEKYEDVYENLKKTLQVDPENEEALNRMWFCVEFTEKYQESIDFHQNLIDSDPYCYLAWFNLAHAQAGLGNNELAVEAFEFVLAINDKYEYAYKDCADVIFKMGNFEKAAEYYKVAISLSKPSKELYYNVGECFESMKSYNQARYYFRKAINVDPNFDEAFYKVGLNYQAENKWSFALSSFERAHKLNGDSSKFVEALANAYIETGNLDEAVKSFRKAVELRASKKENWINLAMALFETGEYRESISVLDEALSEFEQTADLYFIKSAFYYHIGNRNESFVNLETGLLQKYDDFQILFELSPHMVNDPSVINIIEQYSK